MFYYRDDSYATARISNGSCHAVQHARHDGNELRVSDASRTYGHAGVWQWNTTEMRCFARLKGGSWRCLPLTTAGRWEGRSWLEAGAWVLVGSGTSYLKLFSLKIFLVFNEFSRFPWDLGRESGEVWQTLLTVVEWREMQGWHQLNLTCLDCCNPLKVVRIWNFHFIISVIRIMVSEQEREKNISKILKSYQMPPTPECG